MIFSCSSNKGPPAFYDPDSTKSGSTPVADSVAESNQKNDSSNLVVVPFREDNGIKYVKASVNGRNLEMVFNTGCSRSLISEAEANYLYQKGYLKEEDILSDSSSQIAYGRIAENVVFNLKKIIIDQKINCDNVVVTVSANGNAPLCLCDQVFDHFAGYTVDNEKKIIYFKLK